MAAVRFCFSNYGKSLAGQTKASHFGETYRDMRQIIIKKVPYRMKQFTGSSIYHISHQRACGRTIIWRGIGRNSFSVFHLFFVRFRNSFAKICGKGAKKCLKRVALLAHLRMLALEGEKNTRFQHDLREDGHENDARSVPYLESAPAVELRNRGAHRVYSLIASGSPGERARQ